MTEAPATKATVKDAAFSNEVIQAFENVNGSHPGFRPAHAKGAMLTGSFTPSPAARSISRAVHFNQKSTPVTLRFSDFAGIPTVADNDPNAASPRGCAIRFHLGEHVHTDIVAHSHDGFPTRTASEFLEFLKAIYASGPSAPRPNAIETFLGAHPKALAFVQAPKPFPTSFAKESFFSVSAFKFTNGDGIECFGRYRIRPDGGKGEYLDDAAAAAKGANFLFDELSERILKGPIKLLVNLQMAEAGDTVDDSTVSWPKERRELELGTIVLTTHTPDTDAEDQKKIIFDPIPRTDGIDPSGDPLFEPRADIYLASGRRRRAANPAS